MKRRGHTRSQPDKPAVDEEIEEEQIKFVSGRLSNLQESRLTGKLLFYYKKIHDCKQILGYIYLF